MPPLTTGTRLMWITFPPFCHLMLLLLEVEIACYSCLYQLLLVLTWIIFGIFDTQTFAYDMSDCL